MEEKLETKTGLGLTLTKGLMELLTQDAKNKGMSKGRTIVVAWIESLPEEAREIAHRIGPKYDLSAPPNDATICSQCLGKHDRMPDPGPWHTRRCEHWRTRGWL